MSPLRVWSGLAAKWLVVAVAVWILGAVVLDLLNGPAKFPSDDAQRDTYVRCLTGLITAALLFDALAVAPFDRYPKPQRKAWTSPALWAVTLSIIVWFALKGANVQEIPIWSSVVWVVCRGAYGLSSGWGGTLGFWPPTYSETANQLIRRFEQTEAADAA
jgi:hypothetical protein